MNAEPPKCVQARRRPQAMVGSLGKDGNAAWAHLGSSLRASREGVIHGVAPLGKGTTITCETRLVANPFPTRCIHQYKLVGPLVLALSSASTFGMAEPSSKPVIEPWLAGFTAVYTVKKGSFTIGETKRTLSMNGKNSYLFESVTRPKGLAKLLTDGQVVERSIWRLNQQGQPQPLEYTFFNNSEKKTRNVRLNFNWDTYTVTNTINGEPWKMSLVDGTQDKLLFQLQLMRELSKQQPQLNYPVADGGKLKTYTLEILGTENIRTPLGVFETVRVLRVQGKRKTTIWCAKRLNYLPVRIEQRKGNNSPVNAVLTSVKGLGSS